MMNDGDVERLAALIRSTAREELLPRFAQAQAGDRAAGEKDDGSVVTAADLAMQQRLERELARNWHGLAFLGEETAADARRRTVSAGGPLWCLDPLDGTSNFAAGVPFFAVSLALITDEGPQLGVVYDPLRDECFTALRGGPPRCNGQVLRPRPQPAALRACIAMVDFKRLPAALAARISREPPYRSQRNFGACALEWCWLAAGRAQLLLHGGQKVWDYAAGTVVLSSAGGQARSFDGRALPAPGMETRSAVAALDPRLFGLWVEALGFADTENG